MRQACASQQSPQQVDARSPTPVGVRRRPSRPDSRLPPGIHDAFRVAVSQKSFCAQLASGPPAVDDNHKLFALPRDTEMVWLSPIRALART
jgi:hypothetical protein